MLQILSGAVDIPGISRCKVTDFISVKSSFFLFHSKSRDLFVERVDYFTGYKVILRTEQIIENFEPLLDLRTRLAL